MADMATLWGPSCKRQASYKLQKLSMLVKPSPQHQSAWIYCWVFMLTVEWCDMSFLTIRRHWLHFSCSTWQPWNIWLFSSVFSFCQMSLIRWLPFDSLYLENVCIAQLSDLYLGQCWVFQNESLKNILLYISLSGNHWTTFYLYLTPEFLKIFDSFTQFLFHWHVRYSSLIMMCLEQQEIVPPTFFLDHPFQPAKRKFTVFCCLQS